MAAKAKTKELRKPDVSAKSRDGVVTLLRPRPWRWSAMVIVKPTFMTRVRSGFKARGLRFKGRQVVRVRYRSAGWWSEGYLRFELKIKPEKLRRLRMSVFDPTRLTIRHRDRDAFRKLINAGVETCRWNVTE
jgi:hypothetical protein